MNTKKKSILPVILAVVMTVLSLMPVTSGAVFADDSVYVDIDGFRYLLYQNDGTAVVCGRAAGNTDEYITIPAYVEYKSQTYYASIIENAAFQNDPYMKQVTVSDDITTIGSGAFKGCSDLGEIFLPGSITDIGAGSFEGTAFYNDKKNWTDGGLYLDLGRTGQSLIVGESDIKDGTVLIADSAFLGKTTLTSVSIPESVVRIGSSAFYSCSNLSQVTFAENSSLRKIGMFAFSSCTALTSISVPALVNTIDTYAFDGSGLQSFVVPERLEVIKELFGNCKDLKEVTIPSTVTEIRAGAFFGCDNLTTIYYDGSRSQWDAIAGEGKPEIEDMHYGKFDVTFIDGFGNTLDSQIVGPDEGAKAPENPTKEGYYFIGWDPADFHWIKGQDLIVTALWEKKEDLIDINDAKVVLSKTSYTYTGKAIKPAVTSVTLKDGTVLAASDYKVTYKNNTNAGKATVTVTGQGNYKGKAAASFVINKAAQSFKSVTPTKKTYKASKLAKEAQSFRMSAKLKKGNGKITYKLVKDAKKIVSKVTSSGKVTIRKGTKAGKYTISVKVTAAKTANFKQQNKTQKITITVK